MTATSSTGDADQRRPRGRGRRAGPGHIGAVSDPDRTVRSVRRPTVSPLTAVIAASVLFAISNLTWRYGDGSTLALAGMRALFGVALFSPVLVAGARNGELRRALTSGWALAAMVTTGSTVWSSSALFRGLTGPVAASAAAATPAVALVVGAALGMRAFRARVFVAVAACTSFAVSAAWLSGATSVPIQAVAHCTLSVSSGLLIERACRDHGATLLTVAGLVVAAVPAPLAALSGGGFGWTGLAAALTVGLLGTFGRVLRTGAISSLGAGPAAAAGQLNPLLTALLGVGLFADRLNLAGALCLMGAATSGVTAAVFANRGRRPVMILEAAATTP